MIALHETGHPEEALAVADLHADEASPRTATRLARIALAMKRPDVADRSLARVPDANDGSDALLLRLRGQVDLEMGRYTSALGHFDRAAIRHPRPAAVRRQAAVVRGRLAILDPAWRPSLPTLVPLPVAERHRGRILHLLSISLPYSQTGYTVRTQHVARCQQAVGLDPRMVTRAGFPGNKGVAGAADRDVIDGVTYERIRPNLDSGLTTDRIALETARGLAGLIAATRPAVLQPATDYINGQVALALGECLDLPVIYEVRGFLEESWLASAGEQAEKSERFLLAKTVETQCMRRSHGIVTISETMRDDILARGGIDAERIVVIPNAVDIERFVPGPRDAALCAGFGIRDDETVVGYISTLNWYEGIGYLIAAIGRLRRRGRRVRLLIVGDGAERANLEEAAAAEGLLENGAAIFTGRVPFADVERYYRAIDVFVVPRTQDRVSQLVTPLKPYEAMAMEKAVVVTDVPALREMVRDGETGRIVPSQDPQALADVIDDLLDDPRERQRLGAAAREWVAANWTWTLNGRRYREFYERLNVA